MTSITQREAHLKEQQAALEEAKRDLRDIPEVLAKAAQALRADDAKEFERVAERILLGAGATTFARGNTADIRLIQARDAVLTTKSAERESQSIASTVAWANFTGQLRKSLAVTVGAYARVEALEEAARAERLAIDVAVAVMARRVLHGGTPASVADIGDDPSMVVYLRALAAECGWSGESDEAHAGLVAQFSALVNDPPKDPAEFKWRKGANWQDWIYHIFEDAAARPAPWAANLARELQGPETIEEMLERVRRGGGGAGAVRPRRGGLIPDVI